MQIIKATLANLNMFNFFFLEVSKTSKAIYTINPPSVCLLNVC